MWRVLAGVYLILSPLVARPSGCQRARGSRFLCETGRLWVCHHGHQGQCFSMGQKWSEETCFGLCKKGRARTAICHADLICWALLKLTLAGDGGHPRWFHCIYGARSSCRTLGLKTRPHWVQHILKSWVNVFRFFFLYFPLFSGLYIYLYIIYLFSTCLALLPMLAHCTWPSMWPLNWRTDWSM